ncbi:MAG: class II fructose-1,6-bisphosphate aldolase [Candidatus Woesearchaeota archaeon]
MSIVSTKRILEKARRGHYAIGAFNVYNMESVKAVIDAAFECNSPVILAVSEHSVHYCGVEMIISIVKAAGKNAKVPISLHLDHGRDITIIKKCITAGFTSVMIDGSHLSFEDNIAITKKVVSMAKPKNVSVEGELGMIRGAEDNVATRESFFTDPYEAVEFIKRTGVDCLAIAIGTSHGPYKFSGKPKLDFERLRKISTNVKIPLVLHGASEIPSDIVNNGLKSGMLLEGARGVDPESIKKACKLGISKINIDTDLRITATEAIREYLSTNPNIYDPRKIFATARNAIKEIVMAKMVLFGSKGKARL